MPARPGTLFIALRDDLLRRHDDARKALDGDGRLTARQVHQLRVTSKRLRAGWQLLKPIMKDDHLAREAIRDLAGAAALLSAARERDVMRATLALLSEESGKKHARAVFADALALLFPGGAKKLPRPERSDTLRRAFAADAERWRTLELAITDRRLYRRGVSRFYRKAWKLARAAQETGEITLWHANRKWVRYLGFVLPLLEKSGGAPLDPARMEELGQLLGQLHDVYQLVQYVHANRDAFATADDAAYLVHHLRNHESELVARAEKLARKVLRLTPRQFEEAWPPAP